MKVILFGATGMVGQGVLRECLRDDGIEGVLAVGRSSTGLTHPKLRELIRKDLFDFGAAGADLQGYDACFFCLGVSSAGMSEADYTRLTFDLTVGWAQALARINPAMTFVYVSGAGTGGKAMWAQVKARTEDALLALFPSAYMVRLGTLRTVHGEVSKTRWTRIAYAVFKPLLPLVRAIAPGAVISTEELGRAMIRAALFALSLVAVTARDTREHVWGTPPRPFAERARYSTRHLLIGTAAVVPLFVAWSRAPHGFSATYTGLTPRACSGSVAARADDANTARNSSLAAALGGTRTGGGSIATGRVLLASPAEVVALLLEPANRRATARAAS